LTGKHFLNDLVGVQRQHCQTLSLVRCQNRDIVVVVLALVVGMVQSKKQRPALDPQVCTICETAVAVVELLLAKDPNITAAQVEAYLNNLCNVSILAPYKAECLAVLALYADKIVQEVFAGQSGSQVCGSLHLCNSTNTLLDSLRSLRLSIVGQHKPQHHLQLAHPTALRRQRRD